jgi:antirestriction protein
MPRIYVASLADYNAGRLHGVWIDATDDPDEIGAQIDAMLTASPVAGEEWAIHDYEEFEGIRLGEYVPVPMVHALAVLVEEHGAAFAAWWENGSDYGADPDELRELFTESYRGEWGSVADYAAELLEDTGALQSMPEDLRGYFDFEAFGQELVIGGDVWTAPAGAGDVYVFGNY